MADIATSLMGNDHKVENDEGYADYRLMDEGDWDEASKTVMDIGPLHISTDVLNQDPLELPSPTFPCVGSSIINSDLGPVDHHRGDVRDPTADAGVAGLCNLGNTCFMNSGLQCLLSNDRLVKYFIEEFDVGDNDVVKHTLTGNFCKLLHRFWQGGFSELHPGDFKTSVGLDHPQFSDHRQHDCQEFLALLLDSFHEYLNQHCVAKPNDTYIHDEPSPLSACVDSDQPDFGVLVLDSDLSVPVSESTHPNSPEKENSNGLLPSEISGGYNVSEIISKQIEDDRLGSVVTSIDSTIEAVSLDASRSVHDVCSCAFMEVDDENFHRKFPSIDDFCSKDTKTLNTNVLVSTDDTVDLLATDSAKFHKQDNSAVAADEEDVVDEAAPERLNGDQLRELLMTSCTSKPIKETNLVANCHEKFADDEKLSLSASFWDQTTVGSRDKDCFALDGSKRYFEKPLESHCTSCQDAEDDEKPEDINNIKRIKIDDQAAEKNMRMQAKLKVNVEQNQTRSCSQSAVGNPCILSGFGDQLCASPMSTASLTSTSDSAGLLQPEAVVSGSVCSTVEGLLQMQYVRSAERAWQSYISRNQSVVVSTFQGQFKSTVICSECRHVSVTFEPFMYLSVPLPHALERQISVIFVPCDSKQPVRYLMSVHRLDLVRHLRAELMRMIGEDESCDLVIAEVLDHHVARILEDTMQIKMVNDADRMIYAFELLPMPSVEEVVNQSRGQETDENRVVANNITSAATAASHTLPADFEGLENVMSFLTSSVSPDVAPPEKSVLNNSVESSAAASAAACVESMVTQLEMNPVVDWQHNVLNDAVQCDQSSQSLKQDPVLAGEYVWNADSRSSDTLNLTSDTESWHKSGWDSNLGGGFLPDGEESVVCSGADRAVETSDNRATSLISEYNDDELTGVCLTDQWKSCVICLEEMADSELKAHASCGGTLCHNCLEMSTKHLGSPFSKCPVCTGPVTADDDFIPLSCIENYKPKTRILPVPVVNRYLCTDPSSAPSSVILFGHPNVLYLPNKLTGSLLYETVDRIVPLLANYTIVLTNGQGSRCSRCLYTQHCSGCELSRDAAEISLQPGDHLAVQFWELTREQVDAASQFVDHPSMQTLRPNATMTLYDCFQAFTESEVLDEHNPWFCPRCHKNQCASKTMSVWRYPDTLIVYLKRFVYHELSSTKIDNKVLFPLEGLNLADYITGPRPSDLTYDLQSCVLHFGGVNSGHYTAYVRHPRSQQWLYTNDETVLKQTPSDADSSHVYILFYQRRGTQVSFYLPPPKCFADVDAVNDDNDVSCRQSAEGASTELAAVPSVSECTATLFSVDDSTS